MDNNFEICFSQNEFIEWMHILKHAVVVFYKRGDFIQNSFWKKNHECFKNVNLILHLNLENV